jgi:uncharacterized protein (DUF2141 family)
MKSFAVFSAACLAALAAPAAPVRAEPAGPAELDIAIERLRNQRGVLHLCLTRDTAHFPDCGSDPRAVKRSVPAAQGGSIRIAGLAPGAYALSVIHDENQNGRLDTFAGIPREGFGFSRNPTIRFGPPRFDQVRFELGGGIARLAVRMQYLL